MAGNFDSEILAAMNAMGGNPDRYQEAMMQVRRPASSMPQQQRRAQPIAASSSAPVPTSRPAGANLPVEAPIPGTRPGQSAADAAIEVGDASVLEQMSGAPATVEGAPDAVAQPATTVIPPNSAEGESGTGMAKTVAMMAAVGGGIAQLANLYRRHQMGDPRATELFRIYDVDPNSVRGIEAQQQPRQLPAPVKMLTDQREIETPVAPSQRALPPPAQPAASKTVSTPEWDDAIYDAMGNGGGMGGRQIEALPDGMMPKINIISDPDAEAPHLPPRAQPAASVKTRAKAKVVGRTKAGKPIYRTPKVKVR